MQVVPSGNYIPFLSSGENKPKVQIKSFKMDQTPVTNFEFNQFLKANPKWRKTKVLSLFADQNYLKHWKHDLLSEGEIKKIGDSPVVNVSWFAARAFCHAQQGRLASINEWEFAADSDNPKNIQKILRWYGKIKKNQSTPVKKMSLGKYGLRGMHGYIWEWVNDYNSVLITNDSRSTSSDKMNGLFCGGGSLGSKDASNYASFMRYAFRSGLDGKYTYSLLGFRCIKNM
ncbi:MAG: hypothetical protein CME66_07310 [Halobacteriovoraceae bacterium]|nr:hypothetical protein [Halobacteriovoraceae bacterium]